MPELWGTSCDYPNCRDTAIAGSRYCAGHQLKPNQPTGPEKKPAWAAWYHTKAWKQLRVFVLARDPICKLCNRAASTVVDHIKPHKGVWERFVDTLNLQGLCKACHDTKTATEDGGFGATPHNPNEPVATGEEGKQFSSSAVGEDAIDRALAVEEDFSDL